MCVRVYVPFFYEKMATALKYLVGTGLAAYGSVVAFSYTDPRWTQRRFFPEKCPPLKENTAPTRDVCLARMLAHTNPENPFDVLVIGGGSVGTGVALDATTRGLNVGLVERGDYASETSSRSTKMIHGGIRYLEKAVFHLDPLQLQLLAEALRERTIMLHQAPHLCLDLPTVVPCHNIIDVGMYWVGTKMYDFIAGLYGGTIAYSGYILPSTAAQVMPQLRKDRESNPAKFGAVRYHDGQFNDARMCFQIAMTAAAYGAATLNYAKVTSMEMTKNKAGEKVVKTTVTDEVHNKKMEVYSKAVVNAGGPFSGEVEKLAEGAEGKLNVVPALGTHIVLDRRYCPSGKEAMVVPSSDDRVVFTVPWLGGCLVGTTDHKAKVESNPSPPEADVEFLLGNLEPYVGKIPRDGVKSAWAGLRPLVTPKKKKGSDDTQNIVRQHFIAVDADHGLLDVTGGKWTTYRRIAQDAVDTLRDTLLKGKADFKPCCTPDLVLVGARQLDRVPEFIPAGGPIPPDVHRHIRATYGDHYDEIVALAMKDNMKHLKRLVEGCPVVEAEVLWASRQEHCEHVHDFVARRTRMAFVNSAQAEAAIPRVAELMAEEKRWSRSRRTAEQSQGFAAMSGFHTI